MSRIGRFVESTLRVGLPSIAIAALTMAAVFALNMAVFSQGQDRVRDALARAIADGSILESRHQGPLPGLPLAFNKEKNAASIHRHDCLLWQSLIASEPDLSSRVLRMFLLAAAERPVDPRAPENHDCQAVAQALAPDATPRLVWYDRYILAQRALAQMLLSHFSVQASATIVKTAAFSAFGLVLLLAWRRKAFAICVIAALFLLFYGLAYFGGMLYFAPLDVTHAIVLLVAVYRPFGTAPLGSLVVVGATYGSLIAVFEVLTGGIPLALVLISLLTGLSAPDQRSFWQRVLILMIAFTVAVVGCFVLKFAVVSVLSGTNAFSEQFGALLYRTRGDFVREADPSLLERLSHYATDTRVIAVLYLVAVYAYWSYLIGWGSPIFGIALVVAAVISLAIATVLLLRTKQDRKRRFPPALSGCWLAVGVAAAWIMLFWQHSLTHGFFMGRLLIIPLLCGAVAVTEFIRVRYASILLRPTR